MITKRIAAWLCLVFVAALLIGVWQRADVGATRASDEPPVASLAAGSLQVGPLIKNSSNNSAPGCVDAIVPSISATTSVHVCAITARPPGGGGQNLVYIYTFNGVLATADMLALGGYLECFGADAWPSSTSGTLKAFANCRDDSEGNGNDRRQVVFDTGIPARPPNR